MSKFVDVMAQEKDDKKSVKDCPYCGGVRVVVDKNQVPTNTRKELEKLVSEYFLLSLELKWSYCKGCKKYSLLPRH